MPSPSVSVIVPVYNVEKYIVRCVDSVMAQSYDNFELIIVDDRSPCKSMELIKKKYPRRIGTDIKLVYRSENGGLGAARNTGLLHAKSNFVFFLDSDDWLAPDALTCMVDAQMQSDADIVVIDYFIANDTVSYPAFSLRGLDQSQDTKQHLLNYNPTAWNKLFARSLINDSALAFPEERQWYEDVATTPLWLLRAKKMAVVDKPLLYYYQRSDSIMGSARQGSEKLFDIFKSAERLIEKRKSFSRQEWMDFEQNLIFHCAPARLHDIIAIKNLRKRYRFIKQLYRQLNAMLPHWSESEVMDQFAYSYKAQFLKYKRCFSHFKRGNLFRCFVSSLAIKRPLNQKMKLLFVLPTLAIGGAEKVFSNLVNMMDRTAIDLTVYVFEKTGPMEDLLPGDNIKLVFRNSLQNEIYCQSVLQVWRNSRYSLRNKIWKLKVSLVGHTISRSYAHSRFVRPHEELPHHSFDFAACFTELNLEMNEFVLNAVNAARKAIWIHNDFDPKFLDYVDDTSFDRCLRRFDDIVAVSTGAAASLANRFPSVRSKVSVINNLVDETEIRVKAGAEDQTIFEPQMINVLSVGRVTAHVKGYDRLIPILVRLKREAVLFRWHLVGDGPDLALLKQMVADEGIADRVVFHGACQNPYPYIRQADVLLLPSRFEAYPTVVLEAHILGTPCIVAHNAGTSDQFRALKDMVVKNSDLAIYDGLKRFLTDSRLRNKMKRGLANFRYPNQELLTSMYTLIGIEFPETRETKNGKIIRANMPRTKPNSLKEAAS